MRQIGKKLSFPVLNDSRGRVSGMPVDGPQSANVSHSQSQSVIVSHTRPQLASLVWSATADHNWSQLPTVGQCRPQRVSNGLSLPQTATVNYSRPQLGSVGYSRPQLALLSFSRRTVSGPQIDATMYFRRVQLAMVSYSRL